ncbi:MAG: CRTAC1 family protein [Chromatiales bacterium]|nr:CRTAC1 family protein [Chromatiales bacterium]
MRLFLSFALILTSLAAVSAPPLFTEEAATRGLRFTQFNGMSGEFYFAENLGGGVALFDYDNDGDLDVYLTQGHMLGEGKTLQDALFPPPPDMPLSDRLFRNDLDAKSGAHFVDVTEQAGIEAHGYGMGVATGDYDNDGDVDLLVTNLVGVQLWRNNGKGRFEDLTLAAGLTTRSWPVSATFLDFDRDGLLDLYLANYVEFTTARNKPCYAPTSARDYCSPLVYPVGQDQLYHNIGNGRFIEVTDSAGINQASGPALGVVAADFNGDGWTDIYVANDAAANQLWINQKDGSFLDDAFLAGAAVNMDGKPEASMGVDAADFDADGDEDLFMTHLTGETNTIYVNNGEGWFEDRSLATGLAAPSKGYTSFGTAWFDYDNDGLLDLFAANGEVRTVPILAHAGDRYPLHQPNQLFHNLGNARFVETTAEAGDSLKPSEVSRGSAFGDIDNDGDTDIVVANNNGPVRLLINQTGNANHWIGLRLVDRHGRDAIGARVKFSRKGQADLWRRARTDGSYASANDSRILLGLGDSATAVTTEVHWPDGKVETWKDLGTDRYHALTEGEPPQ